MDYQGSSEILDAQPAERTKMKLSQSAKGVYQIEVTAEYGDTERSAEELERAVQRMKEIAERNGLTLAGSQ